MKRRKRYQILILREDGKQYHNRVLNWFQIRRGLTWLSGLIGGLLLGTLGFFVMATWHGNLVATNVSLLKREHQLRKSLSQLASRLDQTRTQLSQSEKELARIEALARQQNLKVPQTLAGTGGAAREGIPVPGVFIDSKDAEVSSIAEALKELSGQANLVSSHTRSLSKVLVPHLEGLARTPSVWPVRGFLASRFGQRQDPIDGMPSYHEGIDISAAYGSPVQAPAEGLVVFTGWRTGYGNCAEISHGRGLLTRYAHLARILVRPGQAVKRWQRIGTVGSTGRSTGSHLHYEVRIKDRPVNPFRYLLY